MSQKAIKTKRSNSARLMGMIENKLKIPGGATTKLDRSNSVGNHRLVHTTSSVSNQRSLDTSSIAPKVRTYLQRRTGSQYSPAAAQQKSILTSNGAPKVNTYHQRRTKGQFLPAVAHQRSILTSSGAPKFSTYL